jgi:hypothetical protein
MERLNFDTIVLILDYLNFDELCCLDIALEHARVKYSVSSAIIKEKYTSFIKKRNSILDAISKESFLNEEDYGYTFPYLTKKLLTKKSNISILNNTVLKKVPNSVAEFLHAHRFTSIGIKREQFHLFNASESTLINSLFGKIKKHKYFILTSHEAKKRWQYHML